MSSIETKLNNFEDAYRRLREAIIDYKRATRDTLYRDGLIQRFEFTFELAWKTTAEVLKEQGVVIDVISPKFVFKAAYSAGYIDNEQIWVNMIDDRNRTSHNYDEGAAETIADNICNRYAKEFSFLIKSLTKR